MLWLYLHKWKLNCNLIESNFKHNSATPTRDCCLFSLSHHWPGCPRLAAVVPGGPHQRHAPQAAPLDHLVLRHAVAKVAAGRAALHDGDPRLEVEADHGRRDDHHHRQGGHHWCPHGDAQMLTGSLVTDASKNIIFEISVNAASVSLLLMALPPFYVISDAMTPNVKFPRRHSVNGRWKKVHSVHLSKGCVSKFPRYYSWQSLYLKRKRNCTITIKSCSCFQNLTGLTFKFVYHFVPTESNRIRRSIMRLQQNNE